MKVSEVPRTEATFEDIRKRSHQHTDIFNTREAGHVVIRNLDPVHNDNVFQKNAEHNFNSYQKSLQRPSSSHARSSATFQEGSYAFNQDWSSPNPFSSKTLVNENANFTQDYHHLRRFQENSSNIFQPSKEDTPVIYKKSLKPVYQTTLHPHDNEIFGRKNVLRQEIENQSKEQKKHGHNYSNLFGLGERTEKSKAQEVQGTTSQPLIPLGMSWEKYQSVVEAGNKDQEVGEDYHRKKYYEDMKSSLATNRYEEAIPVQGATVPVRQMKDIVDKYGHLFKKDATAMDQNNHHLSNVNKPQFLEPPKTDLITRKTASRPVSATKAGFKSKEGKEIEILVTKGLTSKFNLNSLCEQCRLHSLVLSSYNNTVAGEKGTGRGSIKVIPQKKFGFDNVCSWLRSQGLAILVKGA